MKTVWVDDHTSPSTALKGFYQFTGITWEDVTVLGYIREPGDDNREYLSAAYPHFIY